MKRESGDVSTLRRTRDADAERDADGKHDHAREGAGGAGGEPAMQPCLACGLRFPLTPANHDGYGPVCPSCGCLI